MLAKSTVLLVRHAEKPLESDGGTGLSPMGEARAEGYAAYFPALPLGEPGKPAHIDFLFASHESGKSDRPHLTLQPLADRLGLEVDTDYSNKHDAELAKHLRDTPEFDGKNIVVCWHHGRILDLAEKLLHHHPSPDPYWPQEWPDDVFGWLLWMSFDVEGTPTSQTWCYR
jgi:hypothetical protein